MIVELYSHAIAAVFGFGVSLICYIICNTMMESVVIDWCILTRKLEGRYKKW